MANIETNINCCGVLEPTTLESKMACFFATNEAIYSTLIQRGLQQEVYGLEACAFNNLNDLNYFGFLLYMIEQDLQEYEEINGTSLTITEIYDKYKLDCYIQSFNKKGIDITPSLQCFGLYPRDNNSCRTGIGLMQIEGTVCPINQVGI